MTKSGRHYSYCLSCLRTYNQAHKGMWSQPDHKAVFPRKSLGIEDAQEPSDPNAVPYIGWYIDRHLSSSYGFSQRSGSNDYVGYYLVGHYAVARFWHQMQGTAWEQGPDSEEFLDGNYTRVAALKGKRYSYRQSGFLLRTKR